MNERLSGWRKGSENTNYVCSETNAQIWNIVKELEQFVYTAINAFATFKETELNAITNLI